MPMRTASLMVSLLTTLTASAQQRQETRRVNEAVLKSAGKTGEECLPKMLTFVLNGTAPLPEAAQ